MLVLWPGAAQAGDQHPHRTITISGHCHSCDLARENLYGAEIMGAVFIDASLNSTNLNRSTVVESRFIGSDLNDTDFSHARLSGVLFQESSLHDVILSHAHGERLRFDGSELAGAEIDGALLVLANFMSADLTGANFTGSRLFHARFDGARLDQADFTRTRMPRAVLRGVTGHNISFVEVDLRGADLTGAQIEGGDFTGAMLQGAKLANIILIDPIGLSPDMLYGACRTAESQLPEGFDLMDCSERSARQETRPRPRPSPGWRFTITADGIERNITAVPGRAEDLRLDVIRAEQARAVAEYEAMRGALAATREAVAEAQAVAENLDEEIRRELEAEIAVGIERSEQMEAELREREALLVETIENNETVLRLIRHSGERLIYRDSRNGPGTNANMPSIVVDGHRYRLNGRYEWVVDIPLSPEQAEELEPKAPDEAAVPGPPDGP